MPESLLVHLNEKRIFKLSEAAILADEFILTHRTVFPSVRSVSSTPVSERTVKKLQQVNVLRLGSDYKTTYKTIRFFKKCCT